MVLTSVSQTQRSSSKGTLIWKRGGMALTSGRGLGLLLLSFQRGPLLCVSCESPAPPTTRAGGFPELCPVSGSGAWLAAPATDQPVLNSAMNIHELIRFHTFISGPN